MRSVFKWTLALGLFISATSAVGAPRLAQLPNEAREVEGQTNLYLYRRGQDWKRLVKWVYRNYGKQSRIDPVSFAGGIPLLTVESKNPKFKWTHVHFFKVRNKIFISVVPKEPKDS
tara:strand:+ start:351 stop:698 length:348 start_codon:yes stop_codon:yes gene_type:complete